MTVENLVILLEEPSAKKMLDVVVPKILPPGISHRCIPFQGKSDLEKNISLKIRAWQKPNSVFLVMRDQDSGDCKLVKKKLLEECENSRRPKKDYLVRIACHELESFYLGDLDAVRKAGFNINLSKKIKNPDEKSNAAEMLSKITGGEYQKIQGSAAIASFLKLDGSNQSTSFNMLISGIRKIVGLPSRPVSPSYASGIPHSNNCKDSLRFPGQVRDSAPKWDLKGSKIPNCV